MNYASVSQVAATNWTTSLDHATQNITRHGYDAQNFKMEVFAQIFAQGADVPLKGQAEVEHRAPMLRANAPEKGWAL